jgi:hypothetical protein
VGFFLFQDAGKGIPEKTTGMREEDEMPLQYVCIQKRQVFKKCHVTNKP